MNVLGAGRYPTEPVAIEARITIGLAYGPLLVIGKQRHHTTPSREFRVEDSAFWAVSL
jgi:hypothetical protein